LWVTEAETAKQELESYKLVNAPSGSAGNCPAPPSRLTYSHCIGTNNQSTSTALPDQNSRRTISALAFVQCVASAGAAAQPQVVTDFTGRRLNHRAKAHHNLYLDTFIKAAFQSKLMMGKKNRTKRNFADLSHPSKKASASASAATPSGTAGSQAQNAPVRDLWALALERLSENGRAAISQVKLDSRLDILQRLRTAAEKKRNDCEDRKWKFELNGRQIILRDVAEKIIAWVDRFKQIGDIAVNFDPITVAESQQMGALLTGVEKITSLIARCQIYEALYLKREGFQQAEWEQAVMTLKSALVSLYATMLRFLGSAIRAYNQGAIIRTLSAILKPAEVIGFLDECQALENNVAIEVDNCERIFTRRFHASSEERIEKLKQILETPLLRTDSRVAALCKKLESFERIKILKWISSIPYEENHDFASQGRTSGTGEWLLRHEKYCEWRASSASMILWLHGDPGVGKTKLVSTVIDDLLEAFKQFPNDEAFAYFYCDRNQSDRQDPTLILSSFVRQLSTFRDSGVLPQPTVQMYDQKQQTAFASGTLKSKESHAVLAELFQIYPQITLVVDALDECNRETRLGFIDVLDKLIAESSKPVKILISSRRDRDLEHRFEDGPNVQIKAIDNRDDIAIFVNHEITTSEKFWRVDLSSELKELICDTLVDRSEGMFQWVALQIAALQDLCRARDIRNRLGKLPKDLKTAYEELYSQIQSQEESAPMIANRAFQWIMCSCRPLSPAELVAAVCQDPDTDEIDEVDIDIKVVLGACQNLLVVDQELSVCRFSHLSVQEYFETYHWNSCETDCLVGKVCLSLLLNNSNTSKCHEPSTKKRGKDRSAHDVLEYVCLYWPTHVKRLEDKGVVEQSLSALLKRFLGSMDESSLAYQNWYKTIGKHSISGSAYRSNGFLPYVYHQLSPCTRASLAILRFGFREIILDWWTVGFADINQKNSSGDSLLLLGAMRGSVSIVEDLLEKGADVNASGGYYGSALQMASYLGHKSIVQLLLEKGADVNATGGEYGSSLQAASFFGHESTVQLLLEKGADVNATGGFFGSALQAASCSGRESVVQLLLDKTADFNATGGEYGSGLLAASFSGHESTVQLLLDKGADVNATGGNYGSSLQAASYSGHESTVQLLLEKGADVNATGGFFGSALQAASFSCHESIVQLLLEKGADINATGGEYGSALQAASYRGHKSIVQLLLEKGADFNATGGEYGSALQAALSEGHEAVVQLLQVAKAQTEQ
ncbi:hypothetical protein MMC22_011891, partial [Lobaria immixta]|nr:hypothetical protein [Lobaria immixta]